MGGFIIPHILLCSVLALITSISNQKSWLISRCAHTSTWASCLVQLLCREIISPFLSLAPAASQRLRW